MQRIMKRNDCTTLLVVGAVMFLAMMLPDSAMATTGAGGGLPYESWLSDLRDSMTGPVAFTLALIGIVGAGGVLIFGGELNSFLRTIIFLVLVMALLVGAQNMMSGFFGSGAEIGSAATAAADYASGAMGAK